LCEYTKSITKGSLIIALMIVSVLPKDILLIVDLKRASSRLSTCTFPAPYFKLEMLVPERIR